MSDSGTFAIEGFLIRPNGIAFAPGTFSQQLLQTTSISHNNYYKQQLLHTTIITNNNYYKQQLSQPTTITCETEFFVLFDHFVLITLFR